MRGNKISPEQTCFLGEDPRVICKERVVGRGKNGKFYLIKR